MAAAGRQAERSPRRVSSHLGSSDPPHAASDTRRGERIVRTETTYWLVDAVGIVQMVTTAPQCGATYTETSRLLHYHVGQSS